MLKESSKVFLQLHPTTPQNKLYIIPVRLLAPFISIKGKQKHALVLLKSLMPALTFNLVCFFL